MGKNAAKIIEFPKVRKSKAKNNFMLTFKKKKKCFFREYLNFLSIKQKKLIKKSFFSIFNKKGRKII